MLPPAPQSVLATHKPSDLIAQPLFLVGAERSGTTVLRLMLDHHPQIAFFFEFEYAVQKVPDSEGWPDLIQYCKFLETNRIFEAGQLAIDKGLDYPHLIDSFLRQKRDRDGKPLVGATVHYQFDRVLRIWSDARFIHICRDGRDVGRSVIEMGWAGNMYTAVERWIEAEDLWAGMRRKIPANQYIDIQYEVLVNQPEATLTGLCEFIGVPYDRAMLDYSKHSTYQPPSPKAIGQWKTKLPPTEVQLAEAQIGSLLTERGYELSGYPPLEVTRVMEKRLRRQSRWYSAMFRRRRYGTCLFLADFITRRLGPPAWQASVRKRLNAIDQLFLK
jgi:hypothetical protein